MISFEEVGQMLDEIARELPEEVFRALNGGVCLLPETKIHPEARAGDLYTMGEYRHWHDMGRYIVIFYGSFVRVFGHAPREKQRAELRRLLCHELTHHLESMAGARDLEILDEWKMEEYKNTADSEG